MSEANQLPMPVPPEGSGEFLVYRTEDGRTRVACRFAEGTVWLTQAALAGAVSDHAAEHYPAHRRRL